MEGGGIGFKIRRGPQQGQGLELKQKLKLLGAPPPIWVAVGNPAGSPTHAAAWVPGVCPINQIVRPV
jgi:hypothetical protein